MTNPACIVGGLPAVSLELPIRENSQQPQFYAVDVLPGRGMNTLQVRARFPDSRCIDLLASPPIDKAAEILNGGPEDHHGNQSFWMGGAILAPFCGRMRGRSSSDSTIETTVVNERVTLPANFAGRRDGAERHAIHGLILNRKMDKVITGSGPHSRCVEGVLDAGDFGAGWPSRTELRVVVTLREKSLQVEVTAANKGDAMTAIGLGWHPYVSFPSGRRE